jgi:hypothetical protein
MGAVPARDETPELVSRLRVSDVSPSTIEAMQLAVWRLNCAYSHVPPESLLTESRAWLQRLNALREAG